METRAERQTRDGRPGWLINGEKMWITGMHVATHIMLFCRTSGKDGDAKGITCLIIPGRSGTSQDGWFDILEASGLSSSTKFDIQKIAEFEIDRQRWLRGYLPTNNYQATVSIYRLER